MSDPHRYRSRFFTTWRVVALLIAIAMALSTALYLRGPNEVRKVFYPLDYQAEIEQASIDHRVSPYLLAAVIKCESDWDAKAKSSAGAVGLMQLMPQTAQHVADLGLVDTERYPVTRLEDPEVNIQYGAAYLRYLVEHYTELEHAIAAYNAGIGTVDEWASEGRNIRDEVKYPETSHYLLRVVRSKEAYEEIYPDAFPSWGA